MGVSVNSGTDGNDGQPSKFLNGTVMLAQADYGRGGQKGTVACCPFPSNGTIDVQCPGWVNGVNGTDGSIVNYLSPLTNPDNRTYIPIDYLTSFSDCCAAPGLKYPLGNSFGWYNHNGYSTIQIGSCNQEGSCILFENCPNTKVEVSPAPGNNGESGFCVISY